MTVPLICSRHMLCVINMATTRSFKQITAIHSLSRISMTHIIEQHIWYPSSVFLCRHLSSQNQKSYITHKNLKQKEIFENILIDKRKKLKESSQILLDDIKQTKNKMKEKMEAVIEKENVVTIPNVLCVTRIILSPALGFLVLQSNYELALGLFAFAGVTDLLDGWIARTFPSQSSKLGSFLDPMADKVLIATLFLSLTYMGFIPVALTSMIIIRDIILVVAGFYIRYQSLPPPRTLSRYFDVTHATAQLAPTFVSKINTFVQLTLVATTLAAPVFGYVNHEALQALWYITAGTTVTSALSYLTSRNTYRFLKPKKKL